MNNFHNIELQKRKQSNNSQNSTLENLVNKMAETNHKVMNSRGKLQNLSGDLAKIGKLESKMEEFIKKDTTDDLEVEEMLGVSNNYILDLISENKRIIEEIDNLKRQIFNLKKPNMLKPSMTKKSNVLKPPIKKKSNVLKPSIKKKSNVWKPSMTKKSNVWKLPIKKKSNVWKPPIKKKSNVWKPPKTKKPNMLKPPIKKKSNVWKPPIKKKSNVWKPSIKKKPTKKQMPTIVF